MKIFKIILLIFFVFLLYIILRVADYFYTQHLNEQSIKMCQRNNERCDIDTQNPFVIKKFKPAISSIEDKNSCFCKMYNLLLPRLLVYKTFADGKPVKLLRVSWDSYITPITAIENSDAVITYGILTDILYEDNLSQLYKKPLYTYDCGVTSIDGLTKGYNPYITFGSECIGTDKFILTQFGQKSSKKVHSLGQKLKELKLEDKKIYLKMDIAGAEIDVLPDIPNYADNLTGMSIVIRAVDTDRLIAFDKILQAFDKDFVLVARNAIRAESYSGCKCRYFGEDISTVLSLTYINKNLIDKKYLPLKQDYNTKENYITIGGLYASIPDYKISWVVPFSEHLKQIFAKDKKNN
ncbi:MAG: hypothetical protein K6C94_07220 [Candidatus Gastranaerophilales bacterium]|nr:hypothetical protein [Candidatus Gastranaerophilales bacterium]